MRLETEASNPENIEKTEEEKNDVKSEIQREDEEFKEENEDSSDDFVEAVDETSPNSKLKKGSKRKRDPLFDQKLDDFMKDRKLGNIIYVSTLCSVFSLCIPINFVLA